MTVNEARLGDGHLFFLLLLYLFSTPFKFK